MMQHHVTAILWQCVMTPQYMYDRPDNILPLSRYVNLYTMLSENVLMDKNVPCMAYAVCGIIIQAYGDDWFGFGRSIKYIISEKLYIIIHRRTDVCCAALYAIVMQSEDRHEDARYAWHRDGRLFHYFVKSTSQMNRMSCTQDCSNNAAIPSIDAFFNSFLHFRVIRIRQK